MNKEDIARVFTIKQEPKQLSEFIYEIQEKYLSQCIEKWEDFCIDELYKFYQELGFTKVFVINKIEFKNFLLFALPLWKENKIKKTLERWLDLLETDGINSKSMVANDIQAILKELKNEKRNI